MIKLCSKTGSQCLGKQLYRHCDMGIASIKNGVIPVPRRWDPENLTLNKWLYNKNWIPVSSTGMTTSATQIICLSVGCNVRTLECYSAGVTFPERAHNCESSRGLV
uniref:WPE palindromic element domain-containing protein n=1 Tax=Wolbachia endosymbiont (group B) of Eucosma cana TaxID=2954012 RepID=UPI0022261F74|nr:WPE palindromic element domain-containing protein [Wolbachia endosymbiont (group B) of Eucosma cana]